MAAHAKPVRHPHLSALGDRVNAAVRWVWADRHDDAVPSVVQGVLWFAGLTVLFLLMGVQ
jgi:hypothetical protein